MSRISVATIDSPEFINLQPLEISPMMSKCEIKVMYIGQNRNRSFITKEVATEMSKTLRGCPIVGYYSQEKGDFRDHGSRMTIDGDGIHFDCLTVPYGFVAPDAKVWFQNFEDTDEFGNKTVREYLMTTGYLWTKQFKEAQAALEDGGRPHSMELDEETLDGHWAKDPKCNMEFFIVHDAMFSKLCILGQDVEPCFEGSNVTEPNISKTFSKIDDKFTQTLFTMMQELKFALQGGQTMAKVNVNTEVAEIQTQINAPTADFSATQDNPGQNIGNENQNFTENSALGNETNEFKNEDDEKKKQCATNAKKDEDNTDKDPHGKHGDSGDPHNKDTSSNDDEEDKKKDKNYSLLEEKFSLLEQKYSAMEKEYQNLINFKNDVENEKKDDLIKTFYMLSDEDKKEVIENKSKYSLDEIEAKLSVICFRKKVSFEEVKENEGQNNNSVLTYSLNSTTENDVPAWVQACRNTQNKQNN